MHHLGTFGVVLVLALAASCAAYPCKPTVHNAVFGDSLSDDGSNFFTAPAPLGNNRVPRPADGFLNGQFSNGPVWVNLLRDWTADNAMYTDFAFGGAPACPYDSLPFYGDIPHLAEQVNRHTDMLADPVYQALLYKQTRAATVWAGHNDFLYSASDLVTGAVTPSDFARRVVGCIFDSVKTLIKNGERTVVVGTVAPIERAPVVATTVPAFALPIFKSARSYVNQWIQKEILPTNTWADANGFKGRVYLWDAYTAMDDGLNEYACLGFGSATDSCIHYAPGDSALLGSTPLAPGVCANPDKLAFWDPLHPSGLFTKRVIARSIQRRLVQLGAA